MLFAERMLGESLFTCYVAGLARGHNDGRQISPANV